MRIVALLNQKGGVGKTSTAHHLSGTLAAMGRRVLLVDNDPQSSLSQGFWGPTAALGLDPAATILAIHRGDEPYPSDVIRTSGFPGVDLVPGSEAATSFNVPDPHLLRDDLPYRLKSFLEEEEVRADYDLCLIDCPPNLHLCSWSALVASDYLVVPMQPEDYGAQGIASVRRSVAMVQAGPNPALHVLGYVLTMVGRKAIHRAYEEVLRAEYGPLVFGAKVPEAVAFVEAIAHRKPIHHYRPKGQPARAIRALADELLARIDARSSRPIGSEIGEAA